MKPNSSTKTIFCFFLALFCISTYSQTVFLSGSLKEASGKAANESKFVLLQFEASDCNQCNEVADKGFENKELADKLAQTFVCIRIGANHPERLQIAETYKLPADKAFGTLFLDNNGSLLHTFLRTTTFSKEYSKQIDIALSKAGEVLQVGQLEKEYNNGNRSFGFLELLLEKRRALYHPTDELLDEYADALPADSLRSVRTLAFIAKMAPPLGSKADKVLRSDKIVFNQAWYMLPVSLRVNINNRVIYKGMEKAIKEKNEAMAVRTASFAQGTNTNQTAGAKAYDMNMLRYYDEVKDTAAYFRKAIAYYERYFLSMSPDSVKKIDSINLKRMLATVKKDTIQRDGEKVQMKATITYSPIAQQFSSDLNKGAYYFYLRTNNPYLLSIATEWSERALAFFETAEAFDTHAKLLYKQNNKEAAKNEMAKAIAFQTKRGLPTKRFDETLAKMNRDIVLTD